MSSGPGREPVSYAAFLQQALAQQQLFTVALELTYRCNLDCFYCYNDRNIAGKPLSLEQYFQLLSDLQGMQTMFVMLTGGEPLAHPDFFRIAAQAKALGFVIRIKSNGHAMRGRIAQRIKHEVDPFTIDLSVHGATAETHDRQTRVPGSFERLMGNLPGLLELGFRLKLNCTLTQWNAHELSGMYKIAEDWQIPINVYTNVTARDDGDTAPRSIEMTSQQKRSTLQLMHDYKRKQPGLSAKAEPQSAGNSGGNTQKPKCGAGISSLTIDPVGNVLPCTEWRQPLGNIHNTTIADIWNKSNRLADVRQQNYAAATMVEGLSGPSRLISFCPGLAKNQTGTATGLYSDARLKLVFYEDLHKSHHLT